MKLNLLTMSRGATEYALAVVASGCALGMSLMLAPVGGEDGVPPVLMLGSVGVSGWYGGLGPALVSAALSALTLDYFFEWPPYTLGDPNQRSVTYMVAFLMVSILLGSLNARLRLSNRRVRNERDRAEAALLARDDFMATIEHVLRTPLTTIKMYVYTLRDRFVQLSPDNRERILSQMQGEADRLERFVTESLALRRLENMRHPTWEHVTPTEVVAAALDRCLPALGARPIEFALSEDMSEVRIDPVLVHQAVTMLLENVASHTTPGTRVAIDGRLDGDDLHIAISDAGPGIPTDARERIFDRYERLDRGSTGLGLGLAIARAAIQAQGGRLSVDDSTLGGARFTIVIPNVRTRNAAVI